MKKQNYSYSPGDRAIRPKTPAGLNAPKLNEKDKKQIRKETPEEKEMRLNYLFGDGEFQGDSYDFLTMIYKRPEFPLRMRISAAETVIKFDRPALLAAAFKEVHGNEGNIVQEIMGVLNGSGRELPPPRDQGQLSPIDPNAKDAEYTEVAPEQPVSSS